MENIWKRLIVFLALVFFSSFCLLSSQTIAGDGDETLFSFKSEKLKFKEFVQQIEKNSNYSFVYSSDLIDENEEIRLDKTQNLKIQDVLQQLQTALGVQYRVEGTHIVLTGRTTPAAKLQSAETRKTKLIKGKVQDSKGELILGASVVEVDERGTAKDPINGTITDFNGEFALSVSSASFLKISFVGYSDKILPSLGIGSDMFTVVLEGEDQTLDEVVVTAFGTAQKKESVVGSIQTIRPDDLVVPATNLSNAFAGRLSGVIAVQRTGEPGADGSNFYIRGISTLSGARSPLIIIDGVEASMTNLNALPPEAIEGFSILKDATATAMYGTRGANGVLIVTTKSGADLDRPAINVRIENAINLPTSTPEFISGAEYMRLYNEAVTNQSLGDRLYTAEEIRGTELGLNPYVFPNVDWYDELFKSSSMSQNVNFNIRGGSKKLTYFVNVGYSHQEGMLKGRSEEFFSYKNNINLSRYVFQNNFNLNLTKTSKISLKLNTQLQKKRSPSKGISNLYSSIINSNPVLFPVMYPKDVEIDWTRWGGTSAGNTQGTVNPLAELSRGYSDSFFSDLTANLEFDQKLNMLTEGLSFKALASFRNYSSTTTKREQGYNMYEITSYSQEAEGGYSYVVDPLTEPTVPVLNTSGSVGGSRRIYFQTYLNYARRFGLHDVSGMLLYNQDELANNDASTLMTSLPNRKQGMAARASYGYDNRYLFELNVGYNGSENFAKNHRWGLFPAVAVGYTISREKFFEPLLAVVTNLKLRASYGLVGNDQIGGARFAYLSDVDLQGSSSFRTGYGVNTVDHKGPIYARYSNESITWEVGTKMNLGIDIQLFRDLNVVLDFFREDRENIFQERTTIPNFLGAAGTKVFGNFAEVRNQGFDLSLDYGKVLNEDWTVQLKGTFTYAHNEIMAYDEPLYMEYPWLRKVGSSLNRLEGYVSDNLFIDWAHIASNPYQQISGNVAPGDIKYIDQPNVNGEYDGIITDNDRVPMGHPTVPEIVYGFGPSVKYKKLDFSCLFQGVANTSLMMNSFHPFGTQNSRNVLRFIADDYWSPDNQNIYAAYPRLVKQEHANNTVNSDFWLRDASFLKLRSAEVGYSSKKMRVYVSGMNLLTFSSFKLWDPEQGGGSGLKYPTQRTFNIGLQLNL